MLYAAMNLLLLFSAMLSALTGVGVSARAPQACAAVAQQVQVPAVRRVAVMTWRPAATLPRIVDVTGAMGDIRSLTPFEPRFATHRRE